MLISISPLHTTGQGEDPTLGGTKNPWEDILDKASSEGSSLRMPFTDKALKIDKKAPYSKQDTNDVMEGRPKLPVACYRVQLVPGDPGKCALKPVALVKDYSRIEWIERGSVRLPTDAKISAIWYVYFLHLARRAVLLAVGTRKGNIACVFWPSQCTNTKA